METTRHFTATVYIVTDGATALHAHDRLGTRVPPGGHVERDELPHETAIRECEEETGLTPTIVTDDDAIEVDTGRSLPRPRRQMLYDITVHADGVSHQHIDHLYYASVPSRRIDPDDGEQDADDWAWYTVEELQQSSLDADVVQLGIDAIETVRQS